VYYHLTGISRDHLGHDAPVTAGRVALEAQQTGPCFTRKCIHLGKFGLGAVGRHMLAEHAFHNLRMAGTHRVAPGLRCTESLQVDIRNALLI